MDIFSFMHEFDGAYVETASRLDRQHDIRFAMQFAGDDQFLLVAAGKDRAGVFADGARTSNFCISAASGCESSGHAPCRCTDKRLPFGIAQQQVFPQREVEHKPATMPILRNVGEAGPAEPVAFSPTRSGP